MALLPVHRARHCSAWRRSDSHRGPEKHSASIRAGDVQSDPNSQISSLINEYAAEGVLSLLREAKNDGAEVILGDLKRDGAVVRPHILSGIKPGMRAFDRESLGPIIGIMTVDTIDAAVELANATDYSLSGSVWTRNVNVVLDVASRIRARAAGLGDATTGYGNFDIQQFTVERAIAVHPEHAKYPLVDMWLLE